MNGYIIVNTAILNPRKIMNTTCLKAQHKGHKRLLSLFMALALCLLCSHAFAKTNKPMPSNITFQKIATTDDGVAVVVTCFLPLKAKTLSPMLTAYALDKQGAVITRKKSHGGRNYKPEMYARLGRMAASAATTSPTSILVNETGNHFYQFIFFDIENTFNAVVFTPPSKRPSTNKKQIHPPKVSPYIHPLQKRTPLKPTESATQKASTPGKNTPDLASGSDKLTFNEQPQVRSFLKAELTRFQNNSFQPSEEYTSKIHPRKHATTAHAAKALAPYGIIPLWEYLVMGTTPKIINKRLSTPPLPLGELKMIEVVDCVESVCEYTLKNQKKDRSEYRLYFEHGKLKSIVVEISERDMTQRMAILSTLKSIYGGTIWQRGKKQTGVGHSVNKFEYFAKFRDIRLETHGKYLRVFTR